jgi:hypothetical protein
VKATPVRSRKRQTLPPVAPLPVAAPPPPVLPPLHQQTTFPTHAWSLQPGHRNSRALAASWLMLTPPTALSSTPAGYRSPTLFYFTAATGRATSSRRDAAWWMTSNGIGAWRPLKPPSRSCTCCTTPRIRRAASIPRPRFGGADRVVSRTVQRSLPHATFQPVQQHSRKAPPLPR